MNPIRAEQAGLQTMLGYIGFPHPGDSKVEATVCHPRGLRVRGHHPRVDVQLRNP